MSNFIAAVKAALPGFDEAWLAGLAGGMELEQGASLSPSEALELLASELPASYLEACAGRSVASDAWASLFTTFAAERPTFGAKEAAQLDTLWTSANDQAELAYQRAIALRITLCDEPSKERFFSLALRHARRYSAFAAQYFDCLGLAGDDGARLEKLLLAERIGMRTGELDVAVAASALESLAAYPAGRARVPGLLAELGKRGVDLLSVACSEQVVALAPELMWSVLFTSPPAYEFSPGATLLLHLLATDQDLVAHLGSRTDAELDALVTFPISPYDKQKLRAARSKLAKGINDLSKARSIRWSKKGLANLAKLGVGAKSGEGAKARVRLPVIPAEVEAALDLLGERGIRLPKPGKTAAPSTLPPSLRALYGRVGKAPPEESWLSPVSGLAALKRRFDTALSEAEREGELGENLKRALFSATPTLLPFGSSSNGGYYFLDPVKHGDLVFELAHDETELRAEATSLATFLAVRALEPWAVEKALEEELASFREKDEKVAKKAAKVKRS